MPGVPCSTMKAEMPLVPGGAIGHGHHHHHVADAPVRRERLRPVEDPAVARAHGRRAHAGGVAARRGLGQPPRADLLAARQRREKRLLLVLGAERARYARSRGRCAPPPTAPWTGRPAPAPRCRCNSRPPTCRRRRTARGTGCPSGRGGQLRHQLDRKVLRPDPTRARAAGFPFPQTRARCGGAAPAPQKDGNPSIQL